LLKRKKEERSNLKDLRNWKKGDDENVGNVP
jgi:hypothetical protein